MNATVRLLIGFSALLIAGCAAPCDRYCDSAADYIEFCLENGSQGSWREAPEWTTFGVSDKDEYASSCKEDFDSQIDAGGDVIESECEDAANRYEENTDRGFCVDVP